MNVAESDPLLAAVEEAAHLLPSQGPLHVFIHHNTLHAYEHLGFNQATEQAALDLGTEPYESEAAFARHITAGRITLVDIDVVLDETNPSDVPVFGGAPSVATLRRIWLQQPFVIPDAAAIPWLKSEGDLLRRADPALDAVARRWLTEQMRGRSEEQFLRAIWDALAAAQQQKGSLVTRDAKCNGSEDAASAVLSDYLAQAVRALVHPRMIRLTAAYLDQGIAYWPLPHREHGLWHSFLQLYTARAGPPEPWLSGLAAELQAMVTNGVSARQACAMALERMGLVESQWPAHIRRSLLALRGFAGMVRVFETSPELAPVYAMPAKLLDYLAIYLTLEARARTYLARCDLGLTSAGDDLDLRDVYAAFILAQRCGVQASAFDHPENARRWLTVVNDFSNVERRRLWHRAYERRHRVTILDSLAAHHRAGPPVTPAPMLQAIFCIDEREESLRRHLEERCPDIETFGFAGFFGVAMAYQGLDDVKPAFLCPINVKPTHHIREVARETLSGRNYRRRKLRLGAFGLHAHVGSRTLFRGGLLSALIGLFKVLPLVGRCLWPRATERIAHAGRALLAPPPATMLRLSHEHEEAASTAVGLKTHYTIQEMATVVANLLITTGLRDTLAPLCAIVGHGSSSLNNPHESAHDCGACGGGRGAPNARAFAAMANRADVRAALHAQGFNVPDGTWFIGAYHNTCDDAVTYFDVDAVPASHKAPLQKLQQALDNARTWDAHERCRRFAEGVRFRTPERALAHVETRAVDLGQPRPEYGHATNAVCIVGRRERTRGLFLDRRAFLVSYDPKQDPQGETLERILAAVGPVGAGISLEYYFSFVDPTGYGCGTKLPHNITGLVGIMDGHASDLRTGLPWQMVEIHEPVRLLTVVEATPSTLLAIASRRADLAQLITNHWIQLVAWDPDSETMQLFGANGFAPYTPESTELARVPDSVTYYAGRTEHLPLVRVEREAA